MCVHLTGWYLAQENFLFGKRCLYTKPLTSSAYFICRLFCVFCFVYFYSVNTEWYWEQRNVSCGFVRVDNAWNLIWPIMRSLNLISNDCYGGTDSRQRTRCWCFFRISVQNNMIQRSLKPCLEFVQVSSPRLCFSKLTRTLTVPNTSGWISHSSSFIYLYPFITRKLNWKNTNE